MGKNRWDELADILVNYSTQVQKGDRVLVTMMETDMLDDKPRVCWVNKIITLVIHSAPLRSAFQDRD